MGGVQGLYATRVVSERPQRRAADTLKETKRRSTRPIVGIVARALVLSRSGGTPRGRSC